MKYKVGDVVWSRTIGRVCIEEVQAEQKLYKVAYVRVRRGGAALQDSSYLAFKLVRAEDLLDLYATCQICNHVVPNKNGLMEAHGEPLCYGSFFPMR